MIFPFGIHHAANSSPEQMKKYSNRYRKKATKYIFKTDEK